MMSSAVRDFVKERLSVVSDENIDEKTLSNGRSGADVYSIKVESRKARLNGCYIVKVCPAASKREESEADKARRFHGYSPAFSEHLVKYIDKKCIDGRVVLIYEQANKSVLHSTAFSELDGEHLAKYAQRVSRELLGVLNKDARIGGNVEDFFKSILHKQLGEGGRFSVRMRELLDRPEAECIVLDGTIYPNPFYFMTHIACWSNALSDLHLFKGAAHGDLHGLNLLASDESYSIIDYDSVSIDSYLLFDQAYFEFSVFLSNSRDNDLKPWNTMLERLVNPSMFKMVEPCGYYLEYMVRNAVCAGILDWVEETGLEASKDDIECQFLLARIAAGINFFCKRDCAEQSRQRKILLFIGYCFKSLFTTIGYHYNVNDVTTLSISSVFMNTENLWENVFKFKDFLPVLFTDDHYTADDFGTLKSLWSVRWSLVVDVGLEEEEPIVYKSLLENVKTASVTKIALLSGENAERFDNTLNVLSARKPIDIKYANLWRICGKYLLSQLEKLMSSAPEVPLVLLFDCSRETISFRDQLIDRLCDLTLPGATRFAVLRAGLPENLSVEKKQLELQYYWHFSEHPGASLVHAAQCCGLYLQQPAEVDYSANIPSVDGICTFSKEDLIKFSSSIELVYAGCEFSSKNGFIHRGIDTSGRGDSLGEEFYKGGEVTWNDIANNRDLRLLPDKRYQDIKNRLISLMDESSPRIRKMQLIHGAGTGGTTLSKRILWDLKLLVPCVRLKKYVPEDTANILMEIYQRTGKRVLVTIEQGSTVITDEEFNMLIHRIDAENGKLLILMITRSLDAANDESLREDKNVLARLVDTMPVVIATYFMDHFSKYAEKRNNAAERIKLLENITGDSGKGQRTPFFYGFYTFQEEYNLLDRLQSTVAICTPNQRDLLNSLALVTMCSQNIDVTFSELATILNIRDGNRNIYVILDTLPTAISKLITIRIDGVRLCHKIIAENLLLLLYPKDDGHTAIKYVVYEAVCNYIKLIYKIYGRENDRVNKILKELIIDRAYIDADDQKTKFSPLVEAISNWTDKEKLFRLLIEKFPENPHYHNHLARLLAFGDTKMYIDPRYTEAIEEAKQAIKVAEKSELPTSTHRTTLGCIYGQWLIHDLKEELKIKSRGRLARSYNELIESINVRYSLAHEEFECARTEGEVHDSFDYFPQIHLEYQIIDQLIKYDSARTVQQLIEQEPVFKMWYDEHFSIAAELMLKMGELQNSNQLILKETQEKLESVSCDSCSKINDSLRMLLDSDLGSSKRRRRALIYGAYVTNGCKWNGLDRTTCELAEQSMRKNFIASADEHKAADVEVWFELYRRCRYFQAAEAQHILADYMQDGYKKEYLLFLMAFILWESGAAGAAPSTVDKCIREAQLLARQHGVNTTRERDSFVDLNTVGCHIVPVSDVRRDESGNPVGLKIFTGKIIEVDHTYGKILLDKLNLEVIFIPNPTTLNKDEKRTFTRKDISCKVKLNLMFSYSGLRGWNVMKLD